MAIITPITNTLYMQTIDLKQKLECKGIADKNDNWYTKEKQHFYKSPSGKKISLAEQLPNGDYWIVKTWLTNSIICEIN